MKTKRVITLALTVLMLFGATPTMAHNETDQSVKIPIESVRFTYLNSVSANIGVAGDEATYSGYAKANSNSYTINATLKLQRLRGTSWVTVSSCSGSENGMTGVTLSKKRDGLSSGTYRASLYASVYDSNGNYLESTTVYSRTISW